MIKKVSILYYTWSLIIEIEVHCSEEIDPMCCLCLQTMLIGREYLYTIRPYRISVLLRMIFWGFPFAYSDCGDACWHILRNWGREKPAVLMAHNWDGCANAMHNSSAMTSTKVWSLPDDATFSFVLDCHWLDGMTLPEWHAASWQSA